ncbi:MAG: sugar-binding domain-containing protein [Peptostreptococcaceae bacterium]
MKKLLNIQQKLIPQGIELMKKRYLILKQISFSEPIGRRSLALKLDLTERVVRSELDSLKELGLINISSSGVSITNDGLQIITDLKETMNDLLGLSTLEKKVKEKLQIKKVLLVQKNNENDLIKDIGRYGAEYFLSILKENDIVSITGGSTMREFANSIKTDKKYSDVTVVPARGSMGKNIEYQSNNVVATVGKNLNSSYKLLNIPDLLGEEAMKSVIQEPEIKTTLDYIKKTNILVFGIGKADEMAKKRRIEEKTLERIIDNGGVGEAFGYYFDKNGEVVFKLNTVSIDLETFKNVDENIAIFYGKKKVEALMAFAKINKNLVIVTDEESAKEILKR